MKWFAKMERRFGKYAIRNLMKYMSVISVAGTVLGMIQPMIYSDYLSLNVYEILHGQIWRLATFLLYPSVSLDAGFLINIIFYGLMLFVFLNIGQVLEQMWGSFRFNVFYFCGILLMMIVTFVYYFILLGVNGSGYEQLIGYGLATRFDLNDLNWSMFLVFAFLFPNTQFLLYFIIPIKAKWLGFINLFTIAYDIVSCYQERTYLSFMTMFLLIATLINFVVFYMIARNPQGIGATMQQKKRRVVYKNMAKENTTGPRHRCVICGRTEVDSPQLEFRYCSKCEGNYEYCSEHLFTHEHVRRNTIN